jgi:hypothetical protein
VTKSQNSTTYTQQLHYPFTNHTHSRARACVNTRVQRQSHALIKHMRCAPCDLSWCSITREVIRVSHTVTQSPDQRHRVMSPMSQPQSVIESSSHPVTQSPSHARTISHPVTQSHVAQSVTQSPVTHSAS